MVCTNYNKDGTGCLKSVSTKHYYEMFNLTPDPAPAKEFVKAKDIKPKNTTTEKPAPTNPPAPTDEQCEEAIIVVKKGNIKSVKYNDSDLNDILVIILQCLIHISSKNYYGITTLVDVLRGSKSKKVLEAKLDHIPEYGSLYKISREDLTTIIEWLIEYHFILKTKGMYPVLHPTYEGMHYDESITSQKLKKLSECLTKNS